MGKEHSENRLVKYRNSGEDDGYAQTLRRMGAIVIVVANAWFFHHALRGGRLRTAIPAP